MALFKRSPWRPGRKRRFGLSHGQSFVLHQRREISSDFGVDPFDAKALERREKTVCFTVDGRQMAYLDSEMHWFAEKGMIDVEIGASSEDIRLRGSYTVIDSAFAQAKDRPLWAECCVEGQG